jgi:hypothetical protein
MNATLTVLRPDLGLHLCTFLDTKRGGIPLATVLLPLPGGGLLVYSPTGGIDDEVHAAIASLGRVAFLLCPNHYHYMGLREWLTRYPDAVVCATPRATARLAKRAAVPPDPAAWDRLQTALPAHARLLVPEGTGNGEVWLELDDAPGPIWVVCDAWFNMPRHLGGLAGWVCRLLRVTAGLRVGTSWKWVLSDVQAYRTWTLAALAERRPAMLVPCHGELVEGADAVDRLRTALVATLGAPA